METPITIFFPQLELMVAHCVITFLRWRHSSKLRLPHPLSHVTHARPTCYRFPQQDTTWLTTKTHFFFHV